MEGNTNIDQPLGKVTDCEKMEFFFENVTTHSGLDIPKDSDFFATPPPKEIGEIITAETSLKKSDHPLSNTKKSLVHMIWIPISLLVALVVNYFFEFSMDKNSFSLWPILLILFSIFWSVGFSTNYTSFRHICTYVGKKGAAEIIVEENRSNIKVRILNFYNCNTLNIIINDNYVESTTATYEKTDYLYEWKDRENSKIYEISGKYDINNSNFSEDNLYCFSVSIEESWNKYNIDKIVSNLNNNDCIIFKNNDTKIELGVQIMNLYKKESCIYSTDIVDIKSMAYMLLETFKYIDVAKSISYRKIGKTKDLNIFTKRHFEVTTRDETPGD